MAVARPGSSNFSAVHVWLIVFVALWLGSTVWLGIMFTNQQKLVEETNAAKRDKQAFVMGSEGSDPAYTELQQFAAGSNPRQSLARVMLNEIHALAGSITGDSQNARPDAEARIKATIEEMKNEMKDAKLVPNPDQIASGEGLVRIASRLYTWFKNEHQGRLDAEKQLKDANDQLASAQKTIKDLTDKYDGSLNDMKKQVADLQQAKSAFESTKTGEIDDLQKQITARQEALGQVRQDMGKQAAAFGTEIKKQQDIINAQLIKLGTEMPAPLRAQEDAMAREPVGRSLRALPGDSLVHIDLGERDGVTLGMRFAVYSSDRRLPPDGRGKANIEVVNVGPQTSECRVVNPPSSDDPISDRDYVQNIILARNRSRNQHFVIVGDFDLDYDGRPDPTGLAKVKSYIERFGGEVVDTVDHDTDFVVVGSKPAVAAAAKSGATVDETSGPKDRESQHRGQTYEEAIERARQLSVPRLRQEVFLNFVGMEPGRAVA